MKSKNLLAVLLVIILLCAGCDNSPAISPNANTHLVTKIEMLRLSDGSTHYYTAQDSIQAILDCLRRMKTGTILASEPLGNTGESFLITLFYDDQKEKQYTQKSGTYFFDKHHWKQISVEDSLILSFLFLELPQ